MGSQTRRQREPVRLYVQLGLSAPLELRQPCSLDLQTGAECALRPSEDLGHIEIVQAESAAITRHGLLQLRGQCCVQLPPSILQAGLDLWCWHTAAYLNGALHQWRQGCRRNKTYLVKPEAWNVEAELDVLLWQCQGAT